MSGISVDRFSDGSTVLHIFDADAVRAWHADTALPIKLESLNRWHVCGFMVPPEVTSVRLRLEVDGITTLATATWPEPKPVPQPKRKRRRNNVVALAEQEADAPRRGGVVKDPGRLSRDRRGTWSLLRFMISGGNS